MNKFVLILFACLTACTSQTCICNKKSNELSLSCQNMNNASDCRCGFDYSVPFTHKVVVNNGCDIRRDETGIYMIGTDCSKGAKNYCTVNITKHKTHPDSLVFLEAIPAPVPASPKKFTKIPLFPIVGACQCSPCDNPICFCGCDHS